MLVALSYLRFYPFFTACVDNDCICLYLYLWDTVSRTVVTCIAFYSAYHNDCMFICIQYMYEYVYMYMYNFYIHLYEWHIFMLVAVYTCIVCDCTYIPYTVYVCVILCIYIYMYRFFKVYSLKSAQRQSFSLDFEYAKRLWLFHKSLNLRTLENCNCFNKNAPFYDLLKKNWFLLLYRNIIFYFARIIKKNDVEIVW